jgi:hypothetical protein
MRKGKLLALYILFRGNAATYHSSYVEREFIDKEPIVYPLGCDQLPWISRTYDYPDLEEGEV